MARAFTPATFARPLAPRPRKSVLLLPAAVFSIAPSTFFITDDLGPFPLIVPFVACVLARRCERTAQQSTSYAHLARSTQTISLMLIVAACLFIGVNAFTRFCRSAP
jgi:hypothetical protein